MTLFNDNYMQSAMMCYNLWCYYLFVDVMLMNHIHNVKVKIELKMHATFSALFQSIESMAING